MSLTFDATAESAPPIAIGRDSRGERPERASPYSATLTPADAGREGDAPPAKKGDLPSQIHVDPREDGHWVVASGDVRHAALRREGAITITIDPRMERSSPPLTKGEFAALARQISALGRCKDPLLVWRRGAEFVLVDGHNRLWICLLLLAAGRLVPFTIEFRDFPDCDAALAVAREMQTARRNLSDLAAAYYRGKEYVAAKGTRGGDQKGGSKDQSDTSILVENTAQRLALESGVSATTIKRDGNFAVLVDAVADTCGQRAMDAVMNRDGRVTRARVRWLAELEASEMRNVMDEY